MAKAVGLTLVVLATALSSGCGGGRVPIGTTGAPTVARTSSQQIIGHRGASGHAPEHTIAAYDLAVTLGADYIEQDLQMTRDGVLVALHDPRLDRTARGPAANCSGLVIEKTLAQIKSCDVGSWFNDRFPASARAEYVGLTIPTLEEVFERYGHRVNYYIETKNPGDAPGMEAGLLALMDKYALRQAAAERWQVLIQSFSASSLKTIHGLDPSLPLVLLLARVDTTAIGELLDGVKGYAPRAPPRSPST